MRESRTYGSVRGGHRKVLVYSIAEVNDMVDYGLNDRVAIITGANNPWGIGATTALAFAREGAKVVLVYKKIFRTFDASKMDKNGADRYYGANAGTAELVESKLKEMDAEYLVLDTIIGFFAHMTREIS